MHSKIAQKLTSFTLLLIIAMIPFQLSALEDVDSYLETCPPCRRSKPSSLQAKMFAGSAFLAVVAGIVVICLDGGTSRAATERLNHHHHDRHHRPHCRDSASTHKSGDTEIQDVNQKIQINNKVVCE